MPPTIEVEVKDLFDKLDAKLDKIGDKVDKLSDRVETRLDKLEVDVAMLSGKVEGIDKRLGSIQYFVGFPRCPPDLERDRV